MTSKEKALSFAEAIHEKKGLHVRILDVRGIASFSDFFVIASGTSDRHTRALASAVLECAHALGASPIGVEGKELGRWILADLGDVIVHVFLEEIRSFYDLERLWGEAETMVLVAGAAQ